MSRSIGDSIAHGLKSSRSWYPHIKKMLWLHKPASKRPQILPRILATLLSFHIITQKTSPVEASQPSVCKFHYPSQNRLLFAPHDGLTTLHKTPIYNAQNHPRNPRRLRTPIHRRNNVFPDPGLYTHSTSL